MKSAIAIQEPISFIHPNDGGEILILRPEEVFALMYLKQNGIYALVGPGNSMVPVAGTREEIISKVRSNINEQQPTTAIQRPDGKISKHKGNKKRG
jgi:hypothetical protein